MKLTSIIRDLFGVSRRRKARELAVKLALQKITLLKFEQELMRQASQLEQQNAKIMKVLEEGKQK